MRKVPDTFYFSMDDVYQSVSSHTTPDPSLQSCFATANPLYFDEWYSGNKDSLLNFRNYNAAVLPSVPTLFIFKWLEDPNTTWRCDCNVTDDGGEEIYEKGVVYSKIYSTPTRENSPMKTSWSTGIGSYEIELNNLTLGSTYYVRSYAVNLKGVSYSTTVSVYVREDTALKVYDFWSASPKTSPSLSASSPLFLSPGVTYYLPMQLKNPDTINARTIKFSFRWEEDYTLGRYEYSWIKCNWSSSEKYIVFDHDLPMGALKNSIPDVPTVFDIGDKTYQVSVQSNNSAVFWISFQIKPYVNFTTKRFRFICERIPGGDRVSFYFPTHYMDVSYVENTSYRFCFPTSITGGQTLHVIGLGSFEGKIAFISTSGATVYSKNVVSEGWAQVTVPDTLVPGMYYVRAMRSTEEFYVSLGYIYKY